MSRIDDAVTRILRVKLRAGLFDAPRPSERALANDPANLVDRALARRALLEGEHAAAAVTVEKRDVEPRPLAQQQHILLQLRVGERE